jgi:selenocysteine lyase/cysteine desulfurase
VTILGSQRDLFDIPQGISYLNAAYMSPQLRSVTAAGSAALATGEHPWEVFAPDFFAPAEVARDLFARIIGGDADGVAVIPSVSYGVGIATANLGVGPGDTVVLLEDQFPSNVYPWREAVAHAGGEIVTVPRRSGRSWTDGLLAAIEERTAVVAVPNVHWTDGSIVDLVAVGRATRAVGAALVVDATQSLGAMTFDVETIRPDFVVAASYKWLLGPYSIGFLWAAPGRRRGVPLEYGWIAREDSEDFAGLVDYRDDFQPGARRYDMGERSNFLLLPMANAAMEQILGWGVANIAETIGELTDLIGDRATALGLDVIPVGERARHLTGVRLPDGAPQGLTERLVADGVFVSLRGDSIRVAPHLYNDASDVDRLFAALAAVR